MLVLWGIGCFPFKCYFFNYFGIILHAYIGQSDLCILPHMELVFQMLQLMLHEIVWFPSRPCICLIK